MQIIFNKEYNANIYASLKLSPTIDTVQRQSMPHPVPKIVNMVGMGRGWIKGSQVGTKTLFVYLLYADTVIELAQVPAHPKEKQLEKEGVLWKLLDNSATGFDNFMDFKMDRFFHCLLWVIFIHVSVP